MNNEAMTKLLSTCEVIPKAEASPLFENAARRLELPFADYLTIRDLKQLSGCSGEALDALLLALFGALAEGSLCLKMEEDALKRRLAAFIEEGAGELAGKIVDEFSKGRYKGLIGSSPDDYMPLIARNDAAGSFLYFQKYLKYERALKRLLDELIDASGTGLEVGEDKIRKHMQEVLDKKPMCLGSGEPVTLNSLQKLSLALALLKNFVIISGGPGTGKTLVVIALLRLLVRCGIDPRRIQLAAPTGRAAQRMTDTIRMALVSIESPSKDDEKLSEISGATIHRLLRYDPANNRFRYNAANRLQADVIIIDEVSMVDVVMMARLLEAAAPGAKVILLGDKDQLPSVEAGAVLADLIPRHAEAVFTKKTSDAIRRLIPGLVMPSGRTSGRLTDRIVVLEQNYRSESKILEAAKSVNEEDPALVEKIPAIRLSDKGDISWPQRGAYLIDTGAPDDRKFRAVLGSWADRHYLSPHLKDRAIKLTYAQLIKKAGEIDPEKLSGPAAKKALEDIFAYIDQARVLALVRYGPFGSFSANRHIARLLRGKLDPGRRGDIFAGAIIMVAQNDYVKGLFNGDVGFVLKSSSGSYYCVFRRMGSFISYPADTLPPHELAFATTVHKSQGSEYDCVLVALPSDEDSRQLTKEIVYTALTRARDLAVIYGQKAVLSKAVIRKIERQSGISFWD